MTKEEKIKEAYGEDYKFINEFLIGNGFFDGECDDFIHLRLKLYKNGGIDIKIIDEVQFVRPKSLQGIEHNNNWIKIESEADLPKEDCKLHVYPNYLGMDIFFFYNDELSRDELITNHTHYQQIEKPKPPIY